MKKFATLALVVLLAISSLFVLVACNKPLEDTERKYVCTGQWNGWQTDTIKEDGPIAEALMTAISKNDARVKSIKKDLKDAKYLYIFEHEFKNEGATWDISYALKEGDEIKTVNGNMAVKVIRTYEKTEAGETAWMLEWVPSPENHTVKNLTPDTLFLPYLGGAEEPYPGAGAWDGNTAVLKEGAAYVVYVEYKDGSMGLGVIMK